MRVEAAKDEGHRGAPTGPDTRRRLRGVVFEIAPIFCFTVTFAITHRIAVALSLAVAAGLAVCLHHLILREPLWRSLAAFGVVGIGSLLALRSGKATDFFLPSLIIHATLITANLVLLAVGRPLLGVVTGLLTGEKSAWRRCRIRHRAFVHGSLVLFVSPAVLICAGLPLYLSGQAVALGVVDVFGPFVFFGAVVLAWRVYRRAVGTHDCAAEACPTHP